jgi:hypothetical protein
MEIVVGRMKHVWLWLRRTGPYLVVIVLLPGGTLLALALVLRRRRRLRIATTARATLARPGRYVSAVGTRVR